MAGLVGGFVWLMDNLMDLVDSVDGFDIFV